MSTNFNTQTTTVQAILDKYKEIRVPEWFQRNAVWDRLTQVKYLQSIFDNFATTPIVVAEILSCKAVHPSINYDILASQGVRYISLDGQNRTQCLCDFYNNKITFTGTVHDRGQVYEYTNQFYKDMAPAAQFAFKGAVVVFQEYNNMKFEELPIIFRRLNSGKPLNYQENRNSEQSYVAGWVRDRSGVSGKYSGAIGGVFVDTQRERMIDSEYIVKFLVYARMLFDDPSLKVPTVAKSNLDAYYEQGKDTFELSQNSFSGISMHAYGDELPFLDAAMDFHEKALKHYDPALVEALKAPPTQKSILLLSMWTLARLRADKKPPVDCGLNEQNFLNRVLVADAILHQRDITGDGYREWARTNWQGAAQRCSALLKLLEDQMNEKEAA